MRCSMIHLPELHARFYTVVEVEVGYPAHALHDVATAKVGPK
jgi:hypothetical protein